MNFDAFNRRNKILELLIQNGKMTSAEFSEMFEVSQNTIVHDISLLSMNFPIRGQSGRHGGYVYEGIRTIAVTENEVELMLEMFSRLPDKDPATVAFEKRLEEFLGNGFTEAK